MRRRRWTGWSCLALLWPTVSAGAALATFLPAPAAAGAPGMLVGQYGAGGSAHYPSSFVGHNTFSGASTSYYHGNQKYPLIGGGYVPYYGAYAIGVPYSPYYYGTFGMPPLFVPADTLFGPGPLMQNIGNLAPADDGGRGANLPPGQKKVRATNAASKARAGKFLQSGDTQFGKQKFHQAPSDTAKVPLPRPMSRIAFSGKPLPRLRWASTRPPRRQFNAGCGSSPIGPIQILRSSRSTAPNIT